jgi:hypothetical protein
MARAKPGGVSLKPISSWPAATPSEPNAMNSAGMRAARKAYARAG